MAALLTSSGSTSLSLSQGSKSKSQAAAACSRIMDEQATTEFKPAIV